MIRYSGFDDLIDRMSASYPERTALVHYDGAVRSVSWAELRGLVEKRADELAREGRSCEAIFADGSLDCVIEIFAAVRAGRQVALFDIALPTRVAGPLLRMVDADCVWAADVRRQGELTSELEPGSAPAEGAGALLFFTSGTTSSSKAVVLTDASLMASAYNGSSLLPLAPDDTLLCLLPLSHVFGFVCGLLWGLTCGAAVALGRGQRHYVDDFATFSPTAVSLVPKLLQFALGRDLLNPELKLVLIGAADCEDELLAAVQARGIRASLGYGLTETSSGVALSIGDDFHAMSICPDDEVTIAEDGEVIVNAPTCLMRGYYRDAEKTGQAVRDGLLHTGDVGFLDADGRLRVQGRKADVIVLSNGTKLFIPEYEAEIACALGEDDIAVMMSERGLTLVCGKLVRERDEAELMEELAAIQSARPHGSRIGAVALLARELPRTAAGDIERWKIQKELDNGNHR